MDSEKVKRLIKCSVLLAALTTLVLYLCINLKPNQTFPEEGCYYNKELQMQICFDHDQGAYDTYVVVDEKKCACAISFDQGSPYFGMFWMDTNTDKFTYGTVFWSGQCLSFNDGTLVLWDHNEAKEYVFSRIDTPQQRYGPRGQGGQGDGSLVSLVPMP